jgi:hypothetical protein
MNILFTHPTKVFSFALSTACSAVLVLQAQAQNPQIQERVTEIKQAAAANKQALAQYTWQEQETISVKGEVKKTKLYQVSVGSTSQRALNFSPLR